MPTFSAKTMRRVTLVAGRPLVSTWIPIWLQRRATDQLNRVLPPPKGTTVVETSLGGVPGRRVAFGDVRTDRAGIHFHGGAYVFGSSRSHIGMGAELSRRLGCPVYVMDYRLAPEHPWPAAEEDAHRAFTGLVATGVPAGGIILSGDSAGGGLVVATALRALEAGQAPPAMLAMMCPWVDLSSSYPTENRDPALTAEFLALCAARYLAGSSRERPARDLMAADLTGLPRTLIQVSDVDPGTPDAHRFARRARDHGVEVSEQVFGDVFHGFQIYAAVMQEAADALDSVAAHAHSTWARNGGQAASEPMGGTRASS